MKTMKYLLMLALVFGCIAAQDPQANLAIQIVKESPITRMGFGLTVEQYFMAINKQDLKWNAERKVEDVYIVTMTDSSGNYGEWEVNIKTRDIAWPKLGVIRDRKKVRFL